MKDLSNMSFVPTIFKDEMWLGNMIESTVILDLMDACFVAKHFKKGIRWRYILEHNGERPYICETRIITTWWSYISCQQSYSFAIVPEPLPSPIHPHCSCQQPCFTSLVKWQSTGKAAWSWTTRGMICESGFANLINTSTQEERNKSGMLTFLFILVCLLWRGQYFGFTFRYDRTHHDDPIIHALNLIKYLMLL